VQPDESTRFVLRTFGGRIAVIGASFTSPFMNQHSLSRDGGCVTRRLRDFAGGLELLAEFVHNAPFSQGIVCTEPAISWLFFCSLFKSGVQELLSVLPKFEPK
jgi:hypothetical protein